MSNYLLSPNSRACLLSFWALICILACWEFYLAGVYSLVLLLLALIPAWLLYALLLVVRQHYRQDPIVGCVCIFLLVLPAGIQWWTVPEFGYVALLVLPVFGVLLLPERWMFKVVWGLVLVCLVLGFSTPHELSLASEMVLAFLVMSALVSVGTRYWQREQELRRVRFLRDTVSGACSAQFLDEFLEREIARCQVTGGRVSLIGLVIDEHEQLESAHSLKELQSLYRGIVGIVRGRVRRVDEIFRLEEGVWVVMLPDCREDAEIVLREGLTRQLEESDWQDIQQLSLTSSGVTLAHGEDADELLRRLMSRLTKQKQGHVQAAAFRL